MAASRQMATYRAIVKASLRSSLRCSWRLGTSPVAASVMGRMMARGPVRSGDDARLLPVRFRGPELREDVPDRLVGVGLVVTEDSQVRQQRLPGHLELLVGEMDGVHDANLGRLGGLGTVLGAGSPRGESKRETS